MQNPEFAEANKVFLAKCVDVKRQGLAKVEYKPAILENDLRKLYNNNNLYYLHLFLQLALHFLRNLDL